MGSQQGFANDDYRTLQQCDILLTMANRKLVFHVMFHIMSTSLSDEVHGLSVSED